MNTLPPLKGASRESSPPKKLDMSSVEDLLKLWHNARFLSHQSIDSVGATHGGKERAAGMSGFQLFNGAKYAGSLDEERRPSGLGTYETGQHGYAYTGEFSNGLFEGQGRLQAQGAVAEGQFRDGDLIMGSFSVPAGHKFTGTLQDGEWVGPCKVEYAGGAVYEGELRGGVPHGFGKFSDPLGQTYEGGFMNGKREGKGKAVLASGDVMQGWFKDDEFTGEGVKTTSGGYVYSGVFERGFLNGNGRMESTAGVVYHGEFKGGMMEGEGELTCDAEENSEEAREEGGTLPGFKYKGQMVLGHASGTGSLEFAPLVYQGGFLDGRPHGQGTLSSVASLPGKKGGGTAIHRPVASLSFRHGMRTDVFDQGPGGDSLAWKDE